MSKTEIDHYILSKPNLSDNSKRTYRKNYENLSDLMKTNHINDESQENIYNKIKTLKNANTRHMLINIAIMVKKYNNSKHTDLIKRRELIRSDIKDNRNERKEYKKNELPEFKDLIRYRNELFSENNYKAYIINYILIEFSTRNKDLDLIITDSLQEFRKFKKEEKENVLYVANNGKNYYMRNSYKTHRTYGKLLNIFTNKKFNNAVKDYIKEQREQDINQIYLLNTNNGERIGKDSLAHHIMRFTLNGISESDINKISVSRVTDMKQYKLLKKISKNRPTSIQTLIEEYSLSIEEPKS